MEGEKCALEWAINKKKKKKKDRRLRREEFNKRKWVLIG